MEGNQKHLAHIDCAAAAAGVTRRTVERMVRAGALPKYHVRGRTYIDLSELLAARA